jgi:hypothetical protein
MQFLGEVSEFNAHVILDIAATIYFVNSNYLDNFGLQHVKDSSILQLANGEEVQFEYMSSCVSKFNNTMVT